MKKKLYVIGIGYKPLDKRARKIILNSSVILASNRLFEVFKGYDEFEAVKDKVKIINNVDETISYIKSALEPLHYSSTTSPLHHFTSSPSIVLLASGDPMFFGIGRRAVREFGKENVEIIPDLSSIQLAFSRIKEPWDDAFLMSLHGGPDPQKRRRLPYEITDIPSLLQKHDKIAILTDRENNPSVIARFLNSSPVTHHSSLMMYVCERLGYHDERITEGRPEEIEKLTFSEPNVVIIQKTENRSENADIIFGLKEAEISHSGGLITKDEVRAIAIHKLRLPQKGVFWDIGAGSGSVSVEVARMCSQMKVCAIERNEEQIKHIIENKKRFNIYNMEIISGEAPDVLEGLPLPDRIFIGGSGGRLRDIINAIDCKIASGIIVLTATTLETLNMAIALFKEKCYYIDVLEVSISRLKPIGYGHHLSSQNPVFIITGMKEELITINSCR
ncbi:MAG: precorrin-6y C5,15-methyltransferase (decarboxylating) subunit CbiE [Thermodesulfovibrionales bacterium]